MQLWTYACEILCLCNKPTVSPSHQQIIFGHQLGNLVCQTPLTKCNGSLRQQRMKTMLPLHKVDSGAIFEDYTQPTPKLNLRLVSVRTVTPLKPK